MGIKLSWARGSETHPGLAAAIVAQFVKFVKWHV